jgi:quercetin dioxygenase-like cupin family protein
MKKKLFLFAAVALGALTLGTVAATAQSGPVMKEARVTQVVKDVKIQSAQGAPRPATVSDMVRGDTAVRTGVESRAELTFGDLSIARLGANTIFSFNESARTIDLANGAILLRVPKGSGGAKIQTAAVTAAITGTTVIAEYHPKSYAKYLVLEGTMRVYLKGVLGESILLNPGQMLIVNPNAKRLPEPVDFDLARLLQTSRFIQGYPPLPSVPLMAAVQHNQLEQKASGDLIDTNLVIFGRGTLVTLTDPQSLDVVDRKTAAVTLPTPTPTAPPPKPTPTATATATVPPPSPTATATATPKPTPNKFGPPPPITTFVPYPIDNGTVIQTDPSITRAGVTDFGKIYRDQAQDGPFSAWAFTATSPFDTTSNIDFLYGPNAPVAAFKFVALQLVGDPIISTANGGALNLALISVGPIASAPAGNATFTFAGMQSVLIATENGSIDIGGGDILFRNIPNLFFYARGTGSNLTLGGMGIFATQFLRLIAENNISINAPISLTDPSPFGRGILRGTAGGGLTVNSVIETPTPFVTSGTAGNGGTVSLSALGGPLTVNNRIQVSYNDPDPSVPGTPFRRSAGGGTIDLFSGLTTGTGISVNSGASLLALLNPAATNPGAIALFTAGSDIIVNNATLQADRGAISIFQTAAPSVGTAQITINGGTFSTETLTVNSKGNLTFGTTSPVNLSTVTLGFVASNDIAWNGGTLSAAAVRSPGNVTVQAGNDLLITGATTIDRSSAGITDGLNVSLSAGRNFQANQGLRITTDGSGLNNGANITLTSGGTMTVNGDVFLVAELLKGSQGTGSNITINSGGAITMGSLGAITGMLTGATLGNGANISVTGASLKTTTDGVRLIVNNQSGGQTITTGGNISLTLSGNLSTASTGSLFLFVLNSTGDTIQTGANINSSVTGNVSTNQIGIQIDNRLGGFIGTGGTITFNVNGTLTTTGDTNIEILNSQAGTPGGKIGSATFIKSTLGSTSIGGNFNVFIDNTDGSIGPTGDDWTVTLQINGTLSVTGRINVFGDLTTTGAVTAGTLSATNINAPSIAVGSGGITRFGFPNETTINPLHTITTNSLTSTGGINFNGPDIDTPPGFGPFDGGLLTINVPTLTFGPSGADNIQGAVTFNGGASTDNAIAGGSGGTFTVNATGDITVNSAIEATTGLQNSSSEPGGTGGTVNLNSTSGAINVNAPITVSSADAPTGAPRRHSRSGGNINLKSNSTGVAINISNTGELLSLLEPVAAGPGGKITILATGTGSRIVVNGDTGSAGAPPRDTIRADRGTVDIRNTGAGGSISLTNAQIAADTVKIGALGTNGALSIGGGRINADTLLQLYATGSNGSVTFVANATLSGNGMKMIAGNTVTVNNNVVVTVLGPIADIYVPSLNNANYSATNGGNNSTNGLFQTTVGGSPASGANTHIGTPPPPFTSPPTGGH